MNKNGINNKAEKRKMHKERAIAGALLLSGLLFATGCNFSQLQAATEINETVAESQAETSDTSANYDESECTIITLNGSSANISGEGVTVSDGSVTIEEAGSYILTGEYTGTVIVDVSNDEKVQIILDGVKIESASPIFVKQADKVTVTLADGSTNTITQSGDFVTVEEEELNAAIYSKEDLVINGTGSVTITSSNGHGIKSKDDLKVKDGEITIEAGKDGLHAKEEVTIDGGTITITASEGIEGTLVTINDGDITINASDDGINASLKSEDVGTPTVTINGGNLTITMGQGDTDGIDSNGDLYINGGTVTVNAQFPFDYNGTAEHNGGTIIVNGEEIDEITNQFGGGFEEFGGQGRGDRGMQNGQMPEDFDPDNLPEDFDKGNFQGNFNSGDLPEDFENGKMQRPNHTRQQNTR